jgi:hypothetical protein
MHPPMDVPPYSAFVAKALVRGLAWDVGLPVVTYYALHLLGAGDWVALLSATLVAAARVALVAVRDHSLNAFGLLMVIVFGLGLVLSFVTGDPRFLLLKDSITTAVVGLTFLSMAALGHPLTLEAARSWSPERAAELLIQFRTSPAARRWHLKMSVVWGLGMLAEAAVRVPLVYLLPIDVMVVVSAALTVSAFGALILWTGRDLRRQRPRA